MASRLLAVGLVAWAFTIVAEAWEHEMPEFPVAFWLLVLWWVVLEVGDD